MAIIRVRQQELTSGIVEGDLVDALGNPIPASALMTATLTLWDVETGSPATSPSTGILNTRDAQDVLNTNNVTIDTVGHFVWAVQPADNVIVTSRRQVERHRAMFHFAWAAGALDYECELEVMNLRKAN